VFDLVVLVLLLGGALAAAWFVAQPQAEFIVAVRNGVGTTRKGKVTDVFLAVVAEVCAEFGVTTCEVLGVSRGRRIALRFSSGVPEPARQRLRNWWAMSGWSAKGAVRRGPGA
jgi:uncharacterized protein DUF3634